MNFSRRVWGLYQSKQLLLWKISVGRDARDPNNSSNPTSWMRKTWSKLKTPHPQSGTKAGLSKAGLPLEDSAAPLHSSNPVMKLTFTRLSKVMIQLPIWNQKIWLSIESVSKLLCPLLTHACLPRLFWPRVGSGFQSEPINSLGVT